MRISISIRLVNNWTSWMCMCRNIVSNLWKKWRKWSPRKGMKCAKTSKSHTKTDIERSERITLDCTVTSYSFSFPLSNEHKYYTKFELMLFSFAQNDFPHWRRGFLMKTKKTVSISQFALVFCCQWLKNAFLLSTTSIHCCID